MTHRLCLIHQLSALLFGTQPGVWWNMLYLTAVMLAVGAGLNICLLALFTPSNPQRALPNRKSTYSQSPQPHLP